METRDPTTPELYPPLENNIITLIKEFGLIPEARKQVLRQLAAYIGRQVKVKQPARLTFICTHNSRRSHISQIWAQTAAYFYRIPGVEAYSGGTEVTAFNPRAVEAMTKAGFQIRQTGSGRNPVYEVSYAPGQAPVKAFSKVYDAAGNPSENFAAVMTCSQAEEACPFIAGTSLRIAIPYDDPKDFDGTPREEAKYTERTRQIGRELLYAMAQVK